MIIETIHCTSEDFDYESYEIIIDGKRSLSFAWESYSPEDNNMRRNFSSVFDIPEVFRMIEEAVKNGESIEYKAQEFNDSDEYYQYIK